MDLRRGARAKPMAGGSGRWRGVAVAQGKGAQVYEMTAGFLFKAAAGTLQAHLEQTLAGRLHIPRADRQAQRTRLLVVHVLSVIL